MPCLTTFHRVLKAMMGVFGCAGGMRLTTCHGLMSVVAAGVGVSNGSGCDGYRWKQQGKKSAILSQSMKKLNKNYPTYGIEQRTFAKLRNSSLGAQSNTELQLNA